MLPKDTLLYTKVRAKSLFLRVHSLPKNFDFAKYLRRSLTQHITDQLDVKVGARTVVVSSPATGS